MTLAWVGCCSLSILVGHLDKLDTWSLASRRDPARFEDDAGFDVFSGLDAILLARSAAPSLR